jgi:hypothetical protein
MRRDSLVEKAWVLFSLRSKSLQIPYIGLTCCKFLPVRVTVGRRVASREGRRSLYRLEAEPQVWPAGIS